MKGIHGQRDEPLGAERDVNDVAEAARSELLREETASYDNILDASINEKLEEAVT